MAKDFIRRGFDWLAAKLQKHAGLLTEIVTLRRKQADGTFIDAGGIEAHQDDLTKEDLLLAPGLVGQTACVWLTLENDPEFTVNAAPKPGDRWKQEDGTEWVIEQVRTGGVHRSLCVKAK